jgi:hypothetical protein
MTKCLVKKSKVSGINRESSQAAFFQIMASGSTRIGSSEDQQLMTWLSLQIFKICFDTFFAASDKSGATAKPITTEEEDITSYVGGSVIYKLERRAPAESQERQILRTFISASEPEETSLLAAKSRGKLTNITNDAKKMFIELEQVFRDIFPTFTENMSYPDYMKACCDNTVIQDCFYSGSYSVSNSDVKDKVLLDVIKLYFKIRVHHRCRTVIEAVRAKSKISSKDKSLRSKLAK